MNISHESISNDFDVSPIIQLQSGTEPYPQMSVIHNQKPQLNRNGFIEIYVGSEVAPVPSIDGFQAQTQALCAV